MENLPKLEIEGLGWDTPGRYIEFEHAKRLPFESGDLIMVAEKTVINSYQELLDVARAEVLKGKTSIKVVLLPIFVGG